MSNQDSAAETGDPNYECDECGNAFHTSESPDSPLFECPECKSDNASPLNR
ncbi:hypothetical protein [Haloarcula onubensis]|uniref:Rubrerythrin-like domain-containing protein n=1 Tax=Haloarcula onubensis TaxID=2950539 RepID=A0ABU2FNL7_9EURY|nr:hypothetical protein [Halomicroarcula sp. S3CR25-11]MDS0282350.1 hypothetical protein [Halomicroarcula sp. S3CR25-11]